MSLADICSVLYVSDAGSTTQLFLPVTQAIARLSPAVESRLLDVTRMGGPETEIIEVKNGLFLENGFPVEDLELFLQVLKKSVA